MRLLTANKASFSRGSEVLKTFIGLRNGASKNLRVCGQCRYNSSVADQASKHAKASDAIKEYKKDEWLKIRIRLSTRRGIRLQGEHAEAEAEAIAAHLKKSLELMVVEIFSRAKQAAISADPNFVDEPLKKSFGKGDWLEVLGCGVVKQDIMQNAGVPDQLGWAFGIGLERIAMLLFEIPDIRLFWSRDERFLNQFRGVSENLENLKRFVPFSKHPACYKDVSFLVTIVIFAGGGNAANAHDFHENDVMEIVRDVGGDRVEDVRKVDEFTHPKTGRKSLCYRINYRSLLRTLTNEEANEMHEGSKRNLAGKLGVELR
ncbi:hypothetical protein EYC84_000863 [Monilinia fructicola]|uniref:phenylalanine--tRNA ligase n=1 Tax=Monilinia fructicola TaxID=38448 RepID=A0A5M9JIB3_MONFR|nr:hypothetical protein EYC84_000863 [Monilinia fructicola]